MWDSNLTQEGFMKKDECILVDEKDQITGHASKYDAHRFDSQQGLLHRAFSVFLFDSQDRLLLQQRAASKITFPDVWTNTCCSHPLHGYVPTEVDDVDKVVETGNAPGAARAAIRKLQHELGIDPIVFRDGEDAFRFLTRLHYCAQDGQNPEWGEHEMDYILFVKPKGEVQLNPHPDEVQDTKYVTREELVEMMKEENGLKWSPWFRIIAEEFLDSWWRNLHEAFDGTTYVDGKVHTILKE
jgi:isopentenyl-diphosphate delta-isomerase